ncbi:bactofilin family protein [Candidatus Foliamicus sp.]
MKNRLSKTVTTLVGADARVNGNLLFRQSCHVAGLVKGDVLANNGKNTELTVAKGATIEGNVQSSKMLIQGTVLGNLSCSGTISLAASARVEGSIEYGEIEIEKGAVVTSSLKKITAGAASKVPLPSKRSVDSKKRAPEAVG